MFDAMKGEVDDDDVDKDEDDAWFPLPVLTRAIVPSLQGYCR